MVFEVDGTCRVWFDFELPGAGRRDMRYRRWERSHSPPSP